MFSAMKTLKKSGGRQGFNDVVRVVLSVPTYSAYFMYAIVVIASWSQNGCHNLKH